MLFMSSVDQDFVNSLRDETKGTPPTSAIKLVFELLCMFVAYVTTPWRRVEPAEEEAGVQTNAVAG